MTCWGIILAAGTGSRMGAPKALLLLSGKPILQYSLIAFQTSPAIDGIVVVCRKEEIAAVQNLCRAASINKLGAVVPGGKERQDSVREGVCALPHGVEMVAVHDAARPLVPVSLIERLVRKAEKEGAAIPAAPVKDTIKMSVDGRVIGTLKRSLLWAVQTPQAFRVSLFKSAMEKGFEENFYGTDCASLMENAGFPVHIVEAPPENLKITRPSDLRVAEALLGVPIEAPP